MQTEVRGGLHDYVSKIAKLAIKSCSIFTDLNLITTITGGAVCGGTVASWLAHSPLDQAVQVDTVLCSFI